MAIRCSGLWRAVRRSPEWAAALGLVRLAVLTALLVAAAVNRGLLPAALGWALGFAAALLILLARKTP
jgi:hypothetical protein